MAKTIVGVLLLMLSIPPVKAASPSFPELFFKYSSLYDSTVCPPPYGSDPLKPSWRPEWAKEARALEPTFTAIWKAEAPVFFGQLFSDFGKGFSRKELTATLSACTNSFNYSDPLVLRALRYLKSYMGSVPTHPDYAFANTVFHELLHTWLVENFDRSKSALIKQYEADSSIKPEEMDMVLSHLHLMAI